MKKNYFIYVFSFLINFCFAQKETSRWYFGQNAGLNFNSGTPVPMFNGSLNTLEGCASISDISGNLLFYTDGTTVWDKNHRSMPSGKDLFGNSSSTQSAMIVPKPGDDNTYFIFTVDAARGSKGLNYYAVDMRFNEGLGDVVGNNDIPIVINLLTTPSSEKVTAVEVLNEDAFWIISFKEGRFYVFKVDSTGVNESATPGNAGFSGSDDPRGYLKVSPDGTKLVSANMTSGTYIYDFDNATGIVSNERELVLSGEFGYGVEFSPQSKKLYISTGDYAFELSNELIPATEKLYQFNLDIPELTEQNLNATRVELHSYVNQRAALQTGIDGKIYRAIDGASFLGVINNPEADGTASNYRHNFISLGDRVSTQGLPPFIQSFFAATIQVENQCLGDSTNFRVNSNETLASILWDFGDGSPNSTELKPTHIYSLPGRYTVSVTITKKDNDTKTITQDITIFDVPDIISPVSLKQCDDNNDGFTVFDLRDAEALISNDNKATSFTYYLTREDADLFTNAIENLSSFSNSVTNKIFVRVENQSSCYKIAELNLDVTTTAIPEDFILNITECDNDVVDGDDTNGITSFNLEEATTNILGLFPANQRLQVRYYESIESAISRKNEVNSSFYRNERSPFFQQLVVRVDTEDNSCLGLGYHLNLSVSKVPKFEVTDSKFLCVDNLPESAVTLSASNPLDNYTYEWRNQNGQLLNTDTSSQSVEIFESGEYLVTAKNQEGCSKTKTITVAASYLGVIRDIEIKDDRGNNLVKIIVDGDYEFAIDNEQGPYQGSNIFSNVGPGIHTAYVRNKNGCGIVSEEFSIIGYPKFFTPNGDGYNDTWQVVGGDLQSEFKILIFDQFGRVISEINSIGAGWDGTFNGKMMPQSDYWYAAKLEGGKTQRGHFSLIKR